MQKKMWICLALIFVVPGLLFFASCAKKTVQSEPAITAPQPDAAEAEDAAAKLAAEKARQEEIARQKALEEERLKDEAAQQAKLAARNMFVNEDIYFEFDSYVLTPMAQDILMAKAEWLRANMAAVVTIEGHCDERGTNEYNLALGDRRAGSVKSFLTSLGIAAGRLSTISYGEEHPVDAAHNEEAWAKNRRAHFVID